MVGWRMADIWLIVIGIGRCLTPEWKMLEDKEFSM
jgi:hypothetical protein